jgi:hypothetical protein
VVGIQSGNAEAEAESGATHQPRIEQDAQDTVDAEYVRATVPCRWFGESDLKFALFPKMYKV